MATSPDRSKTLWLYHEYSEHGYQGSTEVDTEYTIETTGSTRLDKVVLQIETRRTHSPEGVEFAHDIQRIEVVAADLVEFIKKHGKGRSTA